MVLLNAGHLPAARFLDLSRCQELRGIQESTTELAFGALTTFTELRDCQAVHRHCPNLVKSARLTGALAIQNRGTLGGNIANASPAADTPPEPPGLRRRGGADLPAGHPPGGLRGLPPGLQADGPGPRRAAPARSSSPSPRAAPSTSTGRWAPARPRPSPRSAWPPSPASRVAPWRSSAWGSAPWPPCPARARHAEAVILGKPLGALPLEEARTALLHDLSPIDDIRSTAHYRRVVAQNVLGQMLLELAKS